ncbi:MAG: 4-hydroxythreonine-4-phosphate dehydrogenase PdxA [Elusimicrobia bacterium]|nr:4-hydroxythreonine-4-phosphate dehydrogenase PdxA [Elusimicrobiota bacterium]
MGDPAGIGPEIVLKALARPEVRRRCSAVVFGDRPWLERTARRLKIPMTFQIHQVGALPTKIPIGRPSAAAGRASGEYIAAAVDAVRQGAADAVVTAPINKEAFYLGGWGKHFVGHTEMLAALAGGKSARLMLAHGRLRAVHVTSHIPLKKVAGSLTRAKILETIRVAHAGLKALGIARPRIAVCGLNPHAGDGGVLGNEEARLIAPAVRAARRAGLRADGPLSADVVWPMVKDGRYDAGVAMYHDQGQIAVKLQGIGGAVNLTLGLPMIRTSPAHGTAYDLAGRGTASEESMAEALLLAAHMAGLR